GRDLQRLPRQRDPLPFVALAERLVHEVLGPVERRRLRGLPRILPEGLTHDPFHGAAVGGPGDGLRPLPRRRPSFRRLLARLLLGHRPVPSRVPPGLAKAPRISAQGSRREVRERPTPAACRAEPDGIAPRLPDRPPARERLLPLAERASRSTG